MQRLILFAAFRDYVCFYCEAFRGSVGFGWDLQGLGFLFGACTDQFFCRGPFGIRFLFGAIQGLWFMIYDTCI